MKKNYEKPTVELVKFQYRDQVVVASGTCHTYTYRNDTKELDCSFEYDPTSTK